MYIPLIKEGLILAKKNGLNIPIVYNTSGYESVSSLKELDGLIDIYMPDFKYFDDNLGKKYSKVDNYLEVEIDALKEMYRQVGTNKYNDEGILIKGMIIRHLVLPNNIENSKKVLKWISLNMPSNIMISLMAQYFPSYKAESIEEINRQLNEEEYKQIEDYLYSLNLENGYIQELGKEEEKYVPEF
jgi:putative pyruvate formate lyase activating enzyme